MRNGHRGVIPAGAIRSTLACFMAAVHVPEFNREERPHRLAVASAADVCTFEVLQKAGSRPRRARSRGGAPVISGGGAGAFANIWVASPRERVRIGRPCGQSLSSCWNCCESVSNAAHTFPGGRNARPTTFAFRGTRKFVPRKKNLTISPAIGKLRRCHTAFEIRARPHSYPPTALGGKGIQTPSRRRGILPRR